MPAIIVRTGIWGGGIFLPEAFYKAADEMGVLIFHDMMFTTTSKTHEPSGSAEEAAELQNAIRRLAHRPSMCGGGDAFSICRVRLLPANLEKTTRSEPSGIRATSAQRRVSTSVSS